MELNTFYNKGRSSWFQSLSGIIILIWNEFFPPTPYKVSDKIRAYLWGSAVEIHLKMRWENSLGEFHDDFEFEIES